MRVSTTLGKKYGKVLSPGLNLSAYAIPMQHSYGYLKIKISELKKKIDEETSWMSLGAYFRGCKAVKS